MRMGEGEKLVPSPAVRESGAAEQKPKLARRGSQGRDLRNDSGPLVRQPHDVGEVVHWSVLSLPLASLVAGNTFTFEPSTRKAETGAALKHGANRSP